MSVIEVTEEWKGALSANATAEMYNTSGSLTRRFIVLFDTDDPSWERPVLALTAAGIPAFWAVLDATYPYWFVRSKSVSPDGGPLRFAVDVQYDYFDDPLSQPPQVKWLFNKSSEPIDRDKNDDPIANSSGEAFDPPIQKEFADPVLQIVRNEAAYDPDIAHSFYTAVNGAAWTPASVGKTFAANTAKCVTLEGEKKVVGALTYYQVTYEFQIRKDTDSIGTLIGWKRRLRDQGFREKTGTSDGKPVYASITDAEGNPVSSPAPLNGSGRKLDDGAATVFLTFDVDKQANFTALAL